ncbi:TPA: thioredoxin fold domain-containing protein [Kluyvera ascorbata]|uniref:Thioredoxin-like domain protein n=1 Tax=Kluyvera genomosp. 2 TaxID=2774054 RepID=A0A2T2Y3C2_9ENTR|nr:thioredoxin-like domain protein [Kluyvera genomosp. 2]HAT3918580.1 thioredoxin fold domain-containing protein [Kluyvera ascorbata]HAT3943493.1 thioredoxin fold domain-containing protein [Kluyvera ascorbata]HAT3948739.1 thioredoxin fold domain-containing protein [Kluyvera ascorbata]HAT3954598.1 thioredoxin fold domain-containing protein [Kluyvera ascorbata]
MRYTVKVFPLIALPVVWAMSFSVFSADAPASADESTAEALKDLDRTLPKLAPVTFTAADEKHKVLVFIDNQCSFCSQVVKNIKSYNDAGLTMSFLTVAPPSIRDSVIEDMGRVWCADDRKKSLQGAMAGFLPNNGTSTSCSDEVAQQSALAERLGIQLTPTMIVLDNPPKVILGSAKPDAILDKIAGKAL